MKATYVDSGAFIALIWRRDRQHRRARAHFTNLRKERALLVTSDPVIGETATRLRYDAGIDAVLALRSILERAAAAGQLRIIDSDDDLRASAFDIMERYRDLELSYADAVGAAVATEARVDDVFGFDADFRVMGFELRP